MQVVGVAGKSARKAAYLASTRAVQRLGVNEIHSGAPAISNAPKQDLSRPVGHVKTAGRPSAQAWAKGVDFRALGGQQRGFAAQAEKDSSHDADHSKDRTLDVDILIPYLTHMCDSPPTTVQTSPQELVKMFHDMNVIRRMEIVADSLYKAQLVRGFCHLYDGEEAVAIGMEAGLTFKDAYLGAYRIHGAFIGRGGDPYDVFCELLGKTPGPARGKGGSMHLYKTRTNFYGGWGIVGTSGPLGSGIGLGKKLLAREKEGARQGGKGEAGKEAQEEAEGTVVVASYGDGAANQGQIYEAYNMAALLKLPVIYVCENNHYGMGTSEKRASAQTTFYDRVNYIPGIKVDGMDALAVKGAFQFAKKFALQNGPIIVEADTYRYHGHSMSDPGSTYRGREEIKDMRQSRDPIARVKGLILHDEVMSEEEVKDLERGIKKEVEDAAEKARSAPDPEEKDLWADVYSNDAGITHYGVNRRDVAVTMP